MYMLSINMNSYILRQMLLKAPEHAQHDVTRKVYTACFKHFIRVPVETKQKQKTFVECKRDGKPPLPIP